MENGAFALLKQMVHFHKYFEKTKHDISKVSKGIIME